MTPRMSVLSPNHPDSVRTRVLIAPARSARCDTGSATVKAISFNGIVSDNPRTSGPQPATNCANEDSSTVCAAYDQSVRPSAT